MDLIVSFTGGDGVELFSSAHPTTSGNQRNELATASDLNETSLEQAMIDIAAFADDRGLKVAAKASKMIIPSALQFTADRLMALLIEQLHLITTLTLSETWV